MERDFSSTKTSFWDKTPFATLHLNWRTVVLALVVLALIFTRFWDLGNRSYGHDESIHAWEAWKLVTGQGYVHDPVYHGPFGYHMVAFVYFLFGVNDVTPRLAPAAFSVALVLLVLALRRWMGRAGTWFAVFLLTISPTLMYRGRYFRHDIWLETAALVMVICFFKYLQDKKPRWLYIIAGAMAIAFSSKSIAFMYGAIFGSFWVIYLLVEWFRTRRSIKELPAFDLCVLMATLVMPLASSVFIKALGWNPLDYSQTGMTHSFVIVVILFVASAVIGIWWKRKEWLISAGIFWSIFILLYTTMFTNAQGIATGIVGMLGYWLSQQGVARGGQPWYYFFFLNSVYEFLPALLTGVAVVYYVVIGRRVAETEPAIMLRTSAREPQSEPPARMRAPTRKLGPMAPGRELSAPFVPFLIYFTVTNFLIWTWAGEKMPWQNMHLVLPLGLLAGWLLGQVWDRTDWRKLLQQGAAAAIVLLPVAIFALVVFVGTLLGPARPFAGMALDQLNVTLRWVLSLVVLGITVAMMVYLGRGLGRGGWGRVILAAAFIILSALTIRAAWMQTFVNQDYGTEFLMYADSTPDTAIVMRELDDMSARLIGDKDLKVAYDDDSSWPFVWLLRDYKNASFFSATSGVASDAQVVIVGDANESKVKGQLTGKYVRRGYRLVWWPNQDIYSRLTPASLWNDLKDPARRKYWWDILFYRVYPQATTSWPYVHRFAMYVRKDIAAQLWDFGPEVSGTSLELPEDEYTKKQVQLNASMSFGSYGSEPGQLNYPKAATVDAQGRVYVVDTYNHRIEVFDATGKLVQELGSQGNAAGQFQEPWGIALDKVGNIFVADTWNHRIEKFDSTGKFLKQWGTFGDTAGTLGSPTTFYGPRGIAVDPSGNVLIADTGNKRVVKFSGEGEFITQVGGAGSLSGQFREPVGIAVDRDGNVYVADTWNQRIQKFDSNLGFLSEWQVVGWEGESVVNKPYIAVDSKGNVYATAPEYHRVAKFDGVGKVQAVWAQFGSDMSSLNMPCGIAVDEQDNVYVVDSANHRVQKYEAVK